jgi:hypothetical protein
MRKGEHHSETTKRKMADAHRGIKFSPSRRRNMKAAGLKREARRREMEARLREYEQKEAKA